MRGLERRLSVLELNNAPRPLRLDLDKVSDAGLDRLEQMLLDRDAGRWSAVEELGDDDLRLLASIPVLEEVT